jgi:hypothetical protein
VERTDEQHPGGGGTDRDSGTDPELAEDEPPSGKLDWRDMTEKAEDESLPPFNTDAVLKMSCNTIQPQSSI